MGGAVDIVPSLPYAGIIRIRFVRVALDISRTLSSAPLAIAVVYQSLNLSVNCYDFVNFLSAIFFSTD